MQLARLPYLVRKDTKEKVTIGGEVEYCLQKYQIFSIQFTGNMDSGIIEIHDPRDPWSAVAVTPKEINLEWQ